LVNYLAGEYHLFNKREFEDHLSRCTACLEELANLKELDGILSRLPEETAPPDFAAVIIDSIRNAAPADTPVVGRRPTGRFAFIRDLVAAAAVTLALFWAGGNLFEYQNVNLAGQKINTAVQVYVRTSEGAVNRAYDTLDNLSESFSKGVK